MFERFGKIALFLAFFATVIAVVGGVLKKYYSMLSDASDEYDEGDELSDDIMIEIEPLPEESEE